MYGARRQLWLTLTSAAFLGWVVALHGGFQDDPDEPPVTNQPPNFNGAIGSFTRIIGQAEPTELLAEDPLTFTVRIEASGSVRHPPARFNLRCLPEFARRFVIADLPDVPPAGGRWEFRYQLKPLQVSVTDIPALRFDYYKPGVIPRDKGYRSRYTESIPLIVRPRPEVQPATVEGTSATISIPASLYQWTEDPGLILQRTESSELPGWYGVVILLVAVPAVCACWYTAWRHRYPDLARNVRQRQSRAARHALSALGMASRDPPTPSARRAPDVVADYLRERWDLTAVEPTPKEVSDHLRLRGCAEIPAARAAAFFQDCDRARYAPDLSFHPRDLAASAMRLIEVLEGQTCSPLVS
jgi:hypothetical protein